MCRAPSQVLLSLLGSTLALAACGGRLGGRALVSNPETDRPSFTEKTAFVEAKDGGSTLVVVVRCPLDLAKEVCPVPALFVEACNNRAMAALQARTEIQRPPATEAARSETSTATLGGISIRPVWFDGARELVSIAELVLPNDTVLEMLPRDTTREAWPRERIDAAIAARARTHREETGICRDAYRRGLFACCGAPDTFCFDPSRFDATMPGGRCRCGVSPPCAFDFFCEPRGGGHRCLCRGKQCPCAELNCREGQTCEDGRCF